MNETTWGHDSTRTRCGPSRGTILRNGTTYGHDLQLTLFGLDRFPSTVAQHTRASVEMGTTIRGGRHSRWRWAALRSVTRDDTV
jgi:hypothetical protein